MADATEPLALRHPRSAGERLARRRLAVIGGGLIGTATAYAAARAGERVRVELYEAATVGHPGGASIDVQRAFRHAYAEQEHYTRWTMATVPLWRDLERQSERALFLQTGALWMLHGEDQPVLHSGLERPMFGSGLQFIESSHATLRRLGLPSERLDGAELRRRYPQFPDPSITHALLDHEAGVLRARDAVLAQRDLALRHGVTIHEGRRAVEVRPSADGCGVRFADGSSAEADVVVLATNGWLPELLPELGEAVPAHGQQALFRRILQLTEQPVFHLTPRPQALPALLPERFPLSSFLNTRVHLFPALGGAVKLAIDDAARLIERPEDRRLASAAYRDELFAYAERQIPALAGAGVVQERVCFYDRTPDDDFILDQWDAGARLIVACGFSGHGFKFGPLVGARLAAYALSGRRPDDLGPFRLARFGREPQP